MSILDTLITNRVPGAAYDWRDMNRVAEAMEYVAKRLNASGYDVTVTLHRYTRTDFPTPTVFEHYLAQLSVLRQALTFPPTTPSVPVVGHAKPYMTVQEANDIERILVDLDRLLTLAEGSWLRCGNVNTYCNQRGLPTEAASAIQI